MTINQGIIDNITFDLYEVIEHLNTDGELIETESGQDLLKACLELVENYDHIINKSVIVENL